MTGTPGNNTPLRKTHPPLAWNGGNPGAGAKFALNPGDADTYIKNIKAIGAIPYIEGYAKPAVGVARQLLPEILGTWRHAGLNYEQRLLRPIERRLPSQTFQRRRSRCGSIVCQG